MSYLYHTLYTFINWTTELLISNKRGLKIKKKNLVGIGFRFFYYAAICNIKNKIERISDNLIFFMQLSKYSTNYKQKSEKVDDIIAH